MQNFFNNLGGNLGNLGLGRQNSRNLPIASYTDFLECYPGYIYDRSDLEKGNKVLLPQSILNQIGHLKLPYPMIFELQNTANNQKTYVGVLEFNAPEHQVILPFWIYQHLDLYEGALLKVTLVPKLAEQKGKFLKFQPHQTEMMKNNYNAILEYMLRHFPVLHKGDTIPIQFNNKIYNIDIIDLKPQNEFNAVCIIDTELSYDFIQPLDYIEAPLPGLQKKNSKVDLGQQQTNNPLVSTLQGKAFRLDGKEVNLNQLADKIQAKENEEKLKMENWDPRKHRLPKGIRTNLLDKQKEIKGQGTQIGKTK